MSSRRVLVIYCLAVLAAAAWGALSIRGCNPFSREARLQALVVASLPDADRESIVVVRWGPHRIGEHVSTLRVVYRVGDGPERDELYTVYHGAVQQWRKNTRGDAWSGR